MSGRKSVILTGLRESYACEQPIKSLFVQQPTIQIKNGERYEIPESQLPRLSNP